MKLSLSELTYNLGHVLQQQGDLAAAAAAYEQVVEQLPTFVKARHSLAIVLGEQGQHQAAIRQYRQVIAQQSDIARVYNNFACVLALQGQQAEALQGYQQAIELQPVWAVPHENLGRVLAAQDPAAAAAAYRQAIWLQPDLLSAHYALGQLLLQQGQIGAGTERLRQLLALAPDSVSAHAAIGAAQLAAGEIEPALQHLRQALLPQQARIDAFCDWVAQLQGDDELTLARQACGQFLRTLLGANRPAGGRQTRCELMRWARGWWDQVISGDQSPPLSGQLAQTYSRLGDLLLRYGGASQLQQAELYYQQALRLQTHTKPLTSQQIEPQVELYLKLGQCLVKQGRPNAALMLYRLAQAGSADARLDYSLAELKQVAAEKHQPLPLKGQAGMSPPNVSSLTQHWCRQHSSDYTPVRINASSPQSSSLRISQPAAASVTPIPAACAGLNCQPCLQKLTQRFEPRHLGWGVYQVQAAALTPKPPAYFVAEIPQGQAWITPYQTPWMVTNSTGVLSPDHQLLRDLCREYPGQLPDCPHQPLPLRLPQSRPLPVTGSVAVLAGLSGHNYFHWMVDILPRLELLRRHRDLDEIDWFWINSPKAEFQQQTLRRLGLPAQKILAADCQPFIQAERLIAPAFPGHLGWAEPWAVEFLRQQLLPLASPQLPAFERIYISRRRAHHRRLLNEAAVLALLEPLGFRVVELESLPLAAQIRLFSQAKVILAPHGGGLTNLLFCHSGTTVVEFMAPSYIRQYYWAISHQLGLHHYFVTGLASTCLPVHQLMYPSPLVEDIWLDLGALKNALRQIDLL